MMSETVKTLRELYHEGGSRLVVGLVAGGHFDVDLLLDYSIEKTVCKSRMSTS